MKRTHIVVLGSVITFFSGWIGLSTYSYLSHSKHPEFALAGIEDGASCCGTVTCQLEGQSSYPISYINVSVDGKPLDCADLKRIKAARFERRFELDTSAFEDGKHTLELKAVDASYNANSATKRISFTVDNAPLAAAFLNQDFALEQGRTLHVQIQANKDLDHAEVIFRSHKYVCTPQNAYSQVYECFIPTECEDQPDEYHLTANLRDAVAHEVSLQHEVTIKQAEFKKAHGFHLARGKLDAESEISMSNKELDDALERLLAQSPAEKMWTGPFIMPMEVQRVTTPFGEVRMTAEKGRYHHAAVDLVNHPKCVIWATERGKVIIKQRFLLTGNTVVLDHGMGVTSLYCHLEDFADIEVGSVVRKGAPLGRMGMTGYASGYHLHWEVRVNNVPVDPLQWTEKTF